MKKEIKSSGKSLKLKKASEPSATSPKKAPSIKAIVEGRKISEKTLASTERLEALLAETEKELASLEPRIERLQRQVEKLQSLRLERQKLIAFKLSVKSILSSFTSLSLSSEDMDPSPGLQPRLADWKERAYQAPAYQAFNNNDVFIPEMAFTSVGNLIRRKETLNYELFRAVVLNGGRADSHVVKQYLVEHDIRLPGSGEGFDNIPLSNISSRLNYLVRKGIIAQESRGTFISCYGWQKENAEAI